MAVTSPSRRPQEFGFRVGDHHLVISAPNRTCKAFSFSGTKLWERPCLADGQHPNWRQNKGDTPPGLYKIGAIYNDMLALYQEYNGATPPMTRELRSYGWCSFDLIDLEGNEDGNGRAGVMIHGGGSGLGWPGAWAEYQQLLPTWGCVRMFNADCHRLVYPLTQTGTVFVSVHQDDK